MPQADTVNPNEGPRWFRRGPSPVRASGYRLAPVFDPLSGETHFLSDLPDLLLGVIDAEPRGVAEIVALLNDGEAVDDAAALERITTALVFLQQAELVESTDRSA